MGLFQEKHKAVVLNDRIKRRKETTTNILLYKFIAFLPLSEVLGSFVFVVRFLDSFKIFFCSLVPR